MRKLLHLQRKNLFVLGTSVGAIEERSAGILSVTRSVRTLSLVARFEMSLAAAAAAVGVLLERGMMMMMRSRVVALVTAPVRVPRVAEGRAPR